MTPGARIQAAIELLDRQTAEGAPADVVAGAYFKSRRYIGSKDRAAVASLYYGVLRRRAQLDWWLARAAPSTAAPVAPGARRHVIAYLLLEEGASADEVRDAFGSSKFAPPALTAAEETLAHAMAARSIDHPEQPDWVRHNFPAWLEPELRARFGEALGTEMAALAEAAPLDLRANILKGDRDTAIRALGKEGIAATATHWSPWGMRVEGRPPLSTRKAFLDGLVEVQDEGSQLVALLAEAAPGMRVCDFCAGAGGKSLALAAVMHNKGHIVACDISGPRLDGATRRLRRAGVHNVERKHLDSERDQWVKRHAGGFDRVLVDAPCSGTGTWRRNPDGKWSLTPDDITELVALQARILESAARLVKPGGRLIYATCSLLPAENERQAEAFLAGRDGFKALRVPEIWARAIGGECPAGSTYLHLSPARHSTDGFFVAAFERAQDETSQAPKS